MRLKLAVSLSLAVYFILFICIDIVSEVAYQDSEDNMISWKILKLIMPAIPAVAIVQGMLMRKTHQA
jgi:hypothetical protein